MTDYQNNILIISTNGIEGYNRLLKPKLEDYKFKVYIFQDLTQALPYINESIDSTEMAMINNPLNGFDGIEIAGLLKKLNPKIWNVALGPFTQNIYENLILKLGTENFPFDDFFDESFVYRNFDLEKNLHSLLARRSLNLLNQ